LLNASVGVQRAIGRLRRPPSPRATSVTTVAVSLAAALHLQRRFRTVVAASRLAPRHDRLARGIATHPTRHARLSLIARIGHDRAVALSVAAIVLGASVVSVSASRPIPATGGPTGPGADVRIEVGGGSGRGGSINEAEVSGDVLGATETESFAGTPTDTGTATDIDEATSEIERQAGAEAEAELEAAAAALSQIAVVEGPFLDDGTLLKPVAVNTTVADGSALMETYTVKSGDTLTGIASQYGVSMMTLWWANNLKSKDDLHLGQVLTIPPVTGLVLTVKASDTLASLASRYDVEEQEILDANKLEDPNLVVGQVLAIPGAMGKAIPTPKPTVSRSSGSSSSNRGGSSRAPVNYTGGAFSWPVSGGGNYISQYFHYGHYGIDIAADYGSSVRAAGGGTVIFAGWKGNGGGYQVWIAHGSGLYSTYNHMSAISVGSGQSVSEGQQVGRIGQSGRATGPHLHFEVWRGGVWNGGSRVNPLAYY
jgi:murein DD-endopeptidase MepM/ murein hydrolase activator NlpD